MERAVVLIGVSKTGNLPQLQAVESGVQQMANWASSQGIPDNRIKIITDKSRKVYVGEIKETIKALVDLTTIEQLIVYFSGHGVNNRGEYWLLSGAPEDADEAVNVEDSIRLAWYCGIGHIVLISDACRTAAEGIQAQEVKGSSIFPNNMGSDTAQVVDAFYACARGKPSLEVKSPVQAATEAVNTYSAIYTEVLTECLQGQYTTVLDYEDEDDTTVGLVRTKNRMLMPVLRAEVSKRLAQKLGKTPPISQTPDARIIASDAWISRIPGLSRTDAPLVPVSTAMPDTPFTISEALVSHALAGDPSLWRAALRQANDVPNASPLKEAAAMLTSPFGPTHFETQCGIKLRGDLVSDVVCREATVEILADGSIIRLDKVARPSTAVLLRLKNGTGVVIPAIPEFIAALTFQNDELIDVSYEPSENSRRWSDYAARQNELRMLRASIAASADLGIFRLEGNDALTLAQRMQFAKCVDPSLGLYAAYAYHEVQRRDLIKTIRACLQDDLGFVFFDVMLLVERQLKNKPGPERVSPPFPLLSQGWSLLPAFHSTLPASLQTLHQHRSSSSLWTVFDQVGVAMLTSAIASGEVR